MPCISHTNRTGRDDSLVIFPGADDEQDLLGSDEESSRLINTFIRYRRTDAPHSAPLPRLNGQGVDIPFPSASDGAIRIGSSAPLPTAFVFLPCTSVDIEISNPVPTPIMPVPTTELVATSELAQRNFDANPWPSLPCDLSKIPSESPESGPL